MKRATKFRILARCANSFGPMKYPINTRFLSMHGVNLNRYWGNIVRITACLLGNKSAVELIKIVAIKVNPSQ